MAMKPIALFLIALVPVATLAASAKTITSSQGTADQKSVAGVAGPAAAAQASGQNPADQSTQHPGKKALKKVKVTPPPPMHDPN
jgi:hypothetical protein